MRIISLIIYLFITAISLYNTGNVLAQEIDENVRNFYQKNPIIYKDATIKINTIDPNPTTSSYYPGQRGTNQLIIYTPKYSFARTGTNEFGSEAIVIDGIVAQINGADSIIPPNGFVISGHGRAKKWINENITIGSKVIIDYTNCEVKSFITPESFIYHAQVKLDETNQIINYYLKNETNYNVSKPNMYISRAKNNLEKAIEKPEDVQKYANLAVSNANKALESAIPYKESEFKGIWIRPNERTREDVINTLEKIKKSGIDNIFLETYFHGTTIFPSKVLKKYGFEYQNEYFANFDPLEAFITEAHLRNMKIHIWFETFYTGNKKPQDYPKHILSVNPSWANVTKALYTSDIPVPSLSEHNGYFLDPANIEVQNFLLSLLNEIITRYKPDGIHLDYIRYPQCIGKQYSGYERSNWGYTKYARCEFSNLYEYDPIDIEYGTPMWEVWAKYRIDKVNSFVKSVYNLTQGKNILLSAAIFPDRQKSLDVKMQDWQNWSQNGYLDALIPLILTCDKSLAGILINDIKINTSPKTKVFAGLFIPFMEGSSDDLLRVIHETRKLNTNGIILFDYAHLKPVYSEALTQRIFDIDTKPKVQIVHKQKTEKEKKKKFWKKREKKKK